LLCRKEWQSTYITTEEAQKQLGPVMVDAVQSSPHQHMQFGKPAFNEVYSHSIMIFLVVTNLLALNSKSSSVLF